MNSYLVIVSEFNQEITSSLLEGAKKVLEASGNTYEVVTVPGAFELPQLASVAMKSKKYLGVVALGCVVRGETPHFDYVCQQSAHGLMQVALEESVPVAFGVLTTDTVAQARARSGLTSHQNVIAGKQLVENKGEDAAQVVLSMAKLYSEMKKEIVRESK